METPRSCTEDWTLADVPWVAPLFASALADDPGFRWMFPDDARRLAQVTRLQTLLLRCKAAACLGDRVERKAAAMWTPPGVSPITSLWQEIQAGIVPAAFAVGFAGTVRGLRADASVSARLRRIVKPAWYLDTLGVAPGEQGKGYGGELLRRGLARAGATPVYLFTVKPENVAYYRKFGFEVTDDTVFVSGGPPAWTMRWTRSA
jgi:ribosomal protein S18 acetylase RimI-like enzyme